jgi:hypothetical protein
MEGFSCSWILLFFAPHRIRRLHPFDPLNLGIGSQHDGDPPRVPSQLSSAILTRLVMGTERIIPIGPRTHPQKTIDTTQRRVAMMQRTKPAAAAIPMAFQGLSLT